MPRPFAPSAVRSGAPRLLTAGAQVGVAVEAADLREELRARDRLGVVGEPLLLRPARARSASSSEPSASFAVAPLYVRTAIETIARIDGDHDHRAPRRAPLGAPVDERQRDQQEQRDRRDADRPEDHRLRPLEDPEQVEEEVEVPVRPRDEADRSRVGGVVEELAEPARLPCGRRPSVASKPVWSPGVVNFQITASPMITATTTIDMIVSWSIAYGKNGFPRVLTSSLYCLKTLRCSSRRVGLPSAAPAPVRGRLVERAGSGRFLRPRRRRDAEPDDEIEVQPDQGDDRARKQQHVQRVEARQRVAVDVGPALEELR